MTRRIFKDIEESISREVRRIVHHQDRTIDETFLQQTYDPFTGEIVETPIEADYYDSSADSSHRQYPHFFIRLIKSREDRFSGREIGAYWGNEFHEQEVNTGKITNRIKGYEIVIYSSDGNIDPGNIVKTSVFKINKIQSGNWLRVLSGLNQGTYIISSVTADVLGNHTIELSPNLVVDLPIIRFDSNTRIITFTESIDLSTIKTNDIFEDVSLNTFNILSIDLDKLEIEVDGAIAPDLNQGAKIKRSGNILQNNDTTLITFVVLDSTKPVEKHYGQAEAKTEGRNADIPLDLYYMVRIDSKERNTHIEILNRIWEEFNPPRSALPVITRTADSAEQLLTEDVLTGGNTTIKVGDNSKFNINDKIYIFDDLNPTKKTNGSFDIPFGARVAGKTGTAYLTLSNTVPDIYKVENGTKIVSNADYYLYFFHFVDHMTKDIEGAQYWVHEFTFWVQIWIDRLGEPVEYDGTVYKISVPMEDIEGNIIIDDL